MADLVVVTVHWGRELDLVPRADDIERATAMIDAGADVVFGHHQHRLQPMTIYEGRPIFWGLGNFVWPKLSPESSDTAIAEVRIDSDGNVTAACLLPATIVQTGHPELDEPYDGCDGIDSPTYELP
jgi:poly-gamma-glutamate synthesis protein (capsule biosynthesis protein)